MAFQGKPWNFKSLQKKIEKEQIVPKKTKRLSIQSICQEFVNDFTKISVFCDVKIQKRYKNV